MAADETVATHAPEDDAIAISEEAPSADLDQDADGPSDTKRQKLGDSEAALRSKKFVAFHGNYKGYYSKRRFDQDPYAGDERLALIPKEWMQDKRVLDIGCNVGKVTVEIAQKFSPYRITGVDIDNDLIKKAQRQIRESWSTQEPLSMVKEAAEKERNRNSYRRRSPSRSPSPVPPEKAAEPTPAYFPAAMSRMFGFLPSASEKLLRQYVLPTDEEAKQRTQRKDGKRSRGSVPPRRVCLFPHNLRFKQVDWVNKEIEADKRGYDCILAFSVSKWIHLNNGDDGLIEFFTRVFLTLHPAGRFVLEPQPWSSYAKAAKMSDELKQSYQTIKLRPEDFERILLEDIGFQKVEKLSEEDSGGFKRPLHVYVKAAGSWL